MAVKIIETATGERSSEMTCPHVALQGPPHPYAFLRLGEHAQLLICRECWLQVAGQVLLDIAETGAKNALKELAHR